jgi:hypothetical protein
LSFVASVVSSEATLQIGEVTNDARLKEVRDPKFRSGDVWEYKTRPSEEKSRITILRTETSPGLGMIVHVAVDNLSWKDCQDHSFVQAVPHMPFGRKAIEASLTRRSAIRRALPDYQEGYQIWKEAYQRRHAGVYVIAVKDAIAVAEKTYRSGNGCE